MNLDELQNLDPNNIGAWPLPVRMVLIIGVCLLVGAGFWKFDISTQTSLLETKRQEEVKIKKDFESKQRKAANLNALKMQLSEMKQSFGDMVRQLPDQTEVASLIVDISQTGLAAGLEFELFKPQKEKSSEFYSELPISIRVVGNYHALGEFVSGIATLPRIVTTHDIKIKKHSDDSDDLVMEATAKTYRALSDEES